MENTKKDQTLYQLGSKFIPTAVLGLVCGRIIELATNKIELPGRWGFGLLIFIQLIINLIVLFIIYKLVLRKFDAVDEWIATFGGTIFLSFLIASQSNITGEVRNFW
jgi:hypothetical protein